MDSYDLAVEYLDQLQMHKIKLGLEPMRDFLQQAGSPHEKLKFIHVAGTNGKGSVCASLMGILRKAGYRVGLYTSPHLSNVRERFRLDDSYISKEEFSAIIHQIRVVLGENKITYFECTTALALLWFAEKKPDIVLLETGMGGRLDATNVVTPMVSIITQIGIDHEQYLGTTLEAISGEKAGIIKPSVPVVSGATEPESQKVIAEQAKQLGCHREQLGEQFSIVDGTIGSWIYKRTTAGKAQTVKGLQTGIVPVYQKQNIAVAITAAFLMKDLGFDKLNINHITDGFSMVKWPGRMEFLSGVKTMTGASSVDFLLDGAHNVSGVEGLYELLLKNYGQREKILVWGAMVDKKIGAALIKLSNLMAEIILTKPKGERSATAQQIALSLPEKIQEKCELTDSVEEALRCIGERADKDALVVVAGSLYLIGEMRKLLVGELVDD